MSDRKSEWPFWLNYMDRYYATMAEAWKTERRLLFGTLLFTTILVTLATGIADAQPHIPILGLGFAKLSYPIWLTILAIVVTVFMRGALVAADYSARMGQHLAGIYEAVAPPEAKRLLGDMSSAFSNPHIVRVLGFSFTLARSERERRYNRILGIIEAGGLTVAPILATAIALVRLCVAVSWFWPPIIFLPLFCVQSTECYRFWREQYSEPHPARMQ
jgi:hypothetical protein